MIKSKLLKSGDKFGRLSIIKLNHIEKKYNRNREFYLCKCDCGEEVIVSKAHLLDKTTKSCGCWRKDKTTKHNLYNTRLHGIWGTMKSRCSNKKVLEYKYYGARHITICDEWKNDFMAFYNWAMANGYQDNLTIDRIDVNGNYESNNCRWATTKEQNYNKRNNIKINNMCLKEYWKKNKIKYSYSHFCYLIKHNKYYTDNGTGAQNNL